MDRRNCSNNPMLRWALMLLAAFLTLWIIRSLYYKFAHKAPISSAVVTTTNAPTPTSTSTANSALPATSAKPVETQDKPVSDAILKAYVANKDSKIYSALDGARANLFVFAYPGFKAGSGLAPHAIAVQDKSAENRNTNPAAFVMLQRDVMLPVVSSSPSYRDKFNFMSLMDQKGNLAAVLTPEAVTLYDLEKTIEAAKAGEENPVKVIWNVSTDAIKTAVNKPDFVAPNALIWNNNYDNVAVKANGKIIALIKRDATITPQ